MRAGGLARRGFRLGHTASPSRVECLGGEPHPRLGRPPARARRAPSQELAGRPAASRLLAVHLQLVQEVLALPRLLLQEAPSGPQRLLALRQLPTEPGHLRLGGFQLQAQHLPGRRGAL